jgi:hypothetical protein
MDKNTLKFIIYILIAVIALYLIYVMWAFDIPKTTTTNLIPTTTTIENFDTATDTPLEKLPNIQKYNLLVAPSNMTEPSNIHEISSLGNKFIKQIYIIVEDEITSNIITKREIPLDLEIIVTDNDGNEKYVNMNRYKLNNPPPTELSYPEKTLNLMNLLDMNGELVKGNKLTFKSDTYSFNFKHIFVFGNETGKDYKMLGGERDITSKLSGLDSDNTIANITANKPYLISKIKFKLNTGITNTINTQSVELLNNDGMPTLNLQDITLNTNSLIHYYDNPVLVSNNTANLNINKLNIDLLGSIFYGKLASTTDIQNFKFANGLIDFRDSLNPDTVVGDANLANKNAISMDILNVLDYQKKINTELKELDLNKFNIRELYNQKLDIASTIAKIDRISNNYLKLVQDADAHNAKKFTETIQLLQHLKAELEKQRKIQKVEFDFNLNL